MNETSTETLSVVFEREVTFSAGKDLARAHATTADRGVAHELSNLGFVLERDGFDYSIRDRREKHGLPALQLSRCRDLDAIVQLFKLEL